MSLGRGRGRGFAEVKETTLRRPGQSFASKYSNLINLIDNLTITEVTSGAKIDDIVQAVKDGISTEGNSVDQVILHLHIQALADRQFGIKFAIAFSDAKVCSINNLRSILLRTLQNDFKEREQIKDKSIIQFRNAVSLLGESYNNFKTHGLLFAHILSIPLLQYLEQLLEASEEEDIELATVQIILNGRHLFSDSHDETENFILRARAALIHRNLSARSRGMLIYIIDLANQQFAPLSKTLHDFYTSELEIDTLVDSRFDDKDLSVNIKLENNLNDKDGSLSNNKEKIKPLKTAADDYIGIMKTPKQEKGPKLGTHEKSPPSSINERLSIPRAIRGAGAADSAKDKNTKKSPRGKKDKLTDEQIWSSKQNTSSKVWGHDDRFDKDY